MTEPDRLPVIPAGRVCLRPLADDDVPALFEIFSNPEVMRYWSSPPMEDLSGVRKLLREIREGFEGRTLYEWGVALADGDRVIGTCTLARLDAANRRAELGYSLDRTFWGRGYMTETLTALLDHSFGDLRLYRLEADIDPRNAASIRLLERLGFRSEGLLRERWIVAGEVQDSAIYGLLAREWAARLAAG